MRYLLIISCSQRKVETTQRIPAIDLYDGPVYRMLRKFYRENPSKTNLGVLIISARHALIPAQFCIEPYEQKMTPERAAELRGDIQDKLAWFIRSTQRATNTGFDQAFINLGKVYRQTLEGFHWGLVSTLEATGGIGQRTSQTKAFLERIALSEIP